VKQNNQIMKSFNVIVKCLVIICSISILYSCKDTKISVKDSKPKNIKSKYYIRGIDVSHHQGVIDWTKVKEDNVKFAFVKATEGGNHVDKQLKYNITQSKKNKIPVGAYHYYRFNRTPYQQFLNYKNNVHKKSIDFPPVIDVEYHSNEALKNLENKKKFISDLKTLQTLLHKHYGKKPIIYTDIKFYFDLIHDSDIDNTLWMSDLRSKNLNYLDSSQWVFWQYSFRGKVLGIEKEVDLNFFNGNMEMLYALK